LEKKTPKTLALLFAGMACLTGPKWAGAAEAPALSGGIAGIVRGSAGVPQMGAAVLLYNRQQRLLGRVLTDDHGEFKLLGLVPAPYSVKISLASFVPATKEILVLPGMRSVLNVNLNTLFSTIQFAYPAFESGNIMADDWKWVLRSASSTRPVLRLVEPGTAAASTDADPASSDPAAVSTTEHAAVFSETRGLLRFSAGEGPSTDGVGTEADMGTTFALETSLYGNSLLQFAGNLGYGSATGVPTAAFRTSYSREIAGDTPEISITMRQMLMPGSAGAAVSGPDGFGLPMMRNLSASVDDQYKVTDNVTLQYGFTMDSVTFVGHLNYYSPYARLKYSDENSSFEVAYSSGNPRPNTGGESSPDGSLQRDIDALGIFPRLSLLNNRTEIQRASEYEIVYSRKVGSRTYSGSVYSQYVTNAGITMVAPTGFFAGNVLPDVFAGTAVFDAGNFQNNGYAASVTQNLGSNASVTMIYGDNGALTADAHELVSNNPDDLRSMIHSGRRHAITSRFSATVPHAGTRLISSYQWTGDSRAILAGSLCAADSMQPLPGLNLYVRQPIPGFGGHVEATADIRNMLAQGYLPMNAVGGQHILLVQNPRSVRGGLSFTF
jgi:Carboxypeptidase regulatory-like domain